MVDEKILFRHYSSFVGPDAVGDGYSVHWKDAAANAMKEVSVAVCQVLP